MKIPNWPIIVIVAFASFIGCKKTGNNAPPNKTVNLDTATTTKPPVNPPTSTTPVASIYAGIGNQGFSGDGGPATSAQLDYNVRITIDLAGDLYIADSDNHRIRKVNTEGIITTIGGNGGSGNDGDGGLAINAKLFSLGGLTTDPAGNLYASVNDLIREINTSGYIGTVAGGGPFTTNDNGYLANLANLSVGISDVVFDPSGNMFIADWGNHRVCKVSGGIITIIAGNKTQQSSGDGGPATAAGVPYPEGLAFDGAGNLYIATANRVRKVTKTGIITTVAGNGQRGYSGDGGLAINAEFWPLGITIDQSGNLFIADYANGCVRKVDTHGIITTAVSGLTYPSDVKFDGSGNLFICDYGRKQVIKITGQL